MRALPPGASGTYSAIVLPEHLASRFKDAILPPVLATPVMLLFMENAALNAIRPFLEPGESAVGTGANIRHLAATPAGQKVIAEATVTRVEGRRVEFEIRARDRAQEIGAGTHGRMLIDLDRFGRRACRETKAVSGSHPSTYPPLDVLKPVSENIWIVDSGPFPVAGLIPVPVRMTAIRLNSGEMLLHSPTRRTDLLHQDIETLGPVRHLVAPNPFHWAYIREWKAHCPAACVWAAEGTRERWLVGLKGPRIDAEIADVPPADWRGELDIIMIRGRVFREVAFFHRATRTAILTDLVVNLDPEKVPRWRRSGISVLGSLGPEGKAPAYARVMYRMNGQEAGAAARRLIALKPQRVIFSHGHWFQRDGTSRLAASLLWLTGAG